MKPSALITGGGDGIGLGCVARLAGDLGYNVSVVDRDTSKLEQDISKLGCDPENIMYNASDVTDEASQKRAFAAHMSKYGSLDVAILNAGIGETGDLIWADDWRRCLDVNLIAVMQGVRMAVQAMRRMRSKGVIVIVASAGGIWEMPLSPVYSTAKAGCVMLTKSLAPMIWKKYGIRLCCVCPQFVDTTLVRRVQKENGEAFAKKLMKGVDGKLLQVSQVVDTIVSIIHDVTLVGSCVVLLSSGKVMIPKDVQLKSIGTRLGSCSRPNQCQFS